MMTTEDLSCERCHREVTDLAVREYPCSTALAQPVAAPYARSIDFEEPPTLWSLEEFRPSIEVPYQLSGLHIDRELLAEFASQPDPRPLTGMQQPTEQPPKPRSRDVGPIVAKLQCASSVDEQNRVH